MTATNCLIIVFAAIAGWIIAAIPLLIFLG